MSKTMEWLTQIFTWWNGQTIGTRFYTWRFGERVGEDERGNVFYRTADGKRRWVIYNGPAEATAIGAGWHGWMHHRTDVAPPQENYVAREWEKPHQENLTGTGRAYRPKGSILNTSERPRVTGDYDAWQP
jgi:NADH:ubiquinone oxidoreductase subunit